MKENKKAVVVGLGLRYEKEEHELHPTYGRLYGEGYVYADRGFEDLYLLTEPLPEGAWAEEGEELKDLGYEVSYLALEDDKVVVQDS